MVNRIIEKKIPEENLLYGVRIACALSSPK